MAEKRKLTRTAKQEPRSSGKRTQPSPKKNGKPPAQKKTASGNFPIVGIGASAGGLEALQVFVKRMASDSGMAFVVVSHLDPGHASMMADLLRRYTRMTVEEVRDGVRIEPDHVYVIPPNKYLSAHNGQLFLTEPIEARGFRMPIDYFFRSIAADQGERAIGIILSGTGTDGTIGLSAIREAGGMSMVQSEESARYMGMPRSAILSGLADYVLAVEKMPEQLIAYMKLSHPRLRKAAEDVKGLPLLYQKILSIIRVKTGHDFSSYKKSTILRRIERRMNVHETNDPGIYVRHLQENPEEVTALLKELLISVTNFFREPEAFAALREKVLPDLLGDKPPEYQVRVWVPGCATGEEAYSIAIALQEYMDEARREFKVQIFGTDIDEDAVSVARSGIYPGNIALDVSAERLKRFFVKENGSFKIKKGLRESTIFAVQNVIRDAPFTKLDLVSCRNLLIYFDAELQSRLIPLFHYSLKPGGSFFWGRPKASGAMRIFFPVTIKNGSSTKRRGRSRSRRACTAGSPGPLEEPKSRPDRKRSPEKPAWEISRRSCSWSISFPPPSSSTAGEISCTSRGGRESTSNRRPERPA